MNTNEWALVIFTILGQIAAGALFVLMIARTYAVRKAGVEQANRLTDKPLYVVFPIMVLALLVSLLHLGNLLNIIRAVPNLGSSWLSREVVAAVVFAFVAGLYTLFQWRKIGSDTLRAVIGWITALIGLFLVFSMSMVYMIRTQASWNTFATPVTFLTTALLLGSLMVAVLVVAMAGKEDEVQADLVKGVLRGIAIAAIVLMGIEFVVLPFYMAYLSTQGIAAIKSLSMLFGQFGGILFLRLALVFVGAGLLGTYLYQNASVSGKEKTMALLAYSAFALVLLGELLGRYLFYATHVRIGL